jgi:hypothetical protein
MSVAGTQGVKLYVFVLVLNLVFPVMSYTFTTFTGTEAERYELDLDPDDLMIIGLNLIDGESHNLTWKGGPVEYEISNVSIRAEWDRWRQGASFIFYDGISFIKRSSLSHAFNTWLFPYVVGVKSIASNEWFLTLRNATIINNWDPEYNWSRFVLQDGHHVFVTPYDTDNNITKAVNVDGNLNVTIAKSFDETEDRFNFWNFIKWYSALLIGSRSWGLPSVFSWVIRILAAISFLAAVLLIKELTRV